jgi:hypothetical protein
MGRIQSLFLSLPSALSHSCPSPVLRYRSLSLFQSLPLSGSYPASPTAVSLHRSLTFSSLGPCKPACPGMELIPTLNPILSPYLHDFPVQNVRIYVFYFDLRVNVVWPLTGVAWHFLQVEGIPFPGIWIVLCGNLVLLGCVSWIYRSVGVCIVLYIFSKLNALAFKYLPSLCLNYNPNKCILYNAFGMEIGDA